MTTPFSIRNQSCPNLICKLFGQKGASNIGINSQKKFRLQCKACKKTWAAYADEFYFGLRSDRQKIDLALQFFQQGKSVRSIARELKVSPGTVQRWKSRIFHSHTTI